MRPRSAFRLALVGLVAVAVTTGSARANGDPASDTLPFTTVFFSVQAPQSSTAGRQLQALAAAARKRKFPIRIAVISQPGDLGLIQGLWGKPQQYAAFLGAELFQFGNYKGTLVVSMPAGFGVHGPGATPQGKRALAALPKPGPVALERLGKETVVAVRRLAAANGHPLPVPSAAGSGSGTSTWFVVAAVLAGALVALAGAFFGLRRWLTRP
ncbi:MAG TPA: hypothetical protein VF002_01475 [Gaiellaceae bacterium]